MKLTELTAVVENLKIQLDKVKTEILTRIQELQDALADVSLPPEAVTALTNLQTAIQAMDDIVPDQFPE